MIVRFGAPRTTNQHRDFRVRRDAVLRWLHFLKQNSPSYADIQIDLNIVQELPTNGNIADRIPVVEERDPDGASTSTNSNDESKEDEDEERDNSQQELGPDQCGATGQEEDEQAMVRDYIAQNVRGTTTGTEQDNLETHLLGGTRENPFELPALGGLINDYSTSNIQAAAFPTLFPHGVGDCTNHDRRKDIKLQDASRHLLWYCVKKGDGSYEYPFAQHNQWMYWVQNTCERHRFLSQKRVYISRSPVHSELSVEELKEIVRTKDYNMLREITGRMQMYSSNLLGSDAYFYKNRKQLESLMQQKGMPTLWWTFSAADNHWIDLHALNPKECEESSNLLNEEQKAKKRRKWVRDNPHIVDSYFHDRVILLLKTYLGKDSLEVDWLWFRVEYQGRGTAHIHGCCRLKSDPGLTDLAQKVLEGREARLKLLVSNVAFEDPFLAEELAEDDFKRPFEFEQYSDQMIERLKACVTEGKEAQDRIVRFNDFLISTQHPDPPLDASAAQRDPQTRFQQTATTAHPCSLPISNDEQQYCSILNAVERHLCCAYCERRNKNGPVECRGNFPHDFRDKTILAIKQKMAKNDRTQSSIEILSLRNDRWLNSHCRPLIETWMANVDMRLTIDVGKIVEYMTKYVTKAEPKHNTRTKRFFFSTLDRVIRDAGDDASTGKILKRLMTQLHGERTRSQQETCHLLNSLPLVYCDHAFKKVNLRNDSVEVDLEGGNEDQETISASNSVLDAYAIRLDTSNWLQEADFVSATHNGLETCTLDQFAQEWTVGQRGGHRNKIKQHQKKKTVVAFIPNLPNKKDADTYPEYCKLGLVRYKPWSEDYYSVFGGREATNEQAIEEWESFLLSLDSPPDFLRREMDRLIAEAAEEDNGEGGAHAFGNAAGEEDEEDTTELDFSNLGADPDYFDDDDDFEIDWDEDYQFGLEADLSSCISDDPAAQFYLWRDGNVAAPDEGQDSDTEPTRDSLNEKQAQFLRLLDILLDPNHQSSTDDGDGLSRCCILRGGGGTGKSHTMNCLKGENGPAFVMPLATTGKAASVIRGSTAYNKKNGAAIPVGKEACTPLSGRKLQDLQERWKHVRVLFLDEYSMFHQKHLHYLDLRLRQIMGNDSPFGGLIVVLVGDTAQLPPVKGVPLWSKKRTGVSSDNLAGLHLYFNEFTSVVELTENNRVDRSDPEAVEFIDFLDRLKDGNCTTQDWLRVKQSCSKDTMGAVEWNRRGFNEPGVVHLFCTNKEVQEHNVGELQRLGNPIALITAENSSSKAKSLVSDRFSGLQNSMYAAMGSIMLLTKNIWPEKGLSNGSTGSVVAFDYRGGRKAPGLPYCVWVDFDKQYTGPSFFPGDESRRGWVPIAPVTEYTFSKKAQSSDWAEHNRTMLPLRLAWAWTIWKAQGQTIKGKVVIKLGPKEMEHGLTYVAFSRATRLSNIGIIGGIPETRLTTQIRNQQKLQKRLVEDQRLHRLAEQTRLAIERLRTGDHRG
jgi:ATP-dependent DNA helicase PIF1